MYKESYLNSKGINQLKVSEVKVNQITKVQTKRVSIHNN